MGRRIFLFLVAMLMTLLAERLWVGHAGRAADDCLTKPGTDAPQGSHWYYRLDRASHRQCWYLAAEKAKVRPQARQAARPDHAKPIARSAAAADAAPFAQEPAQASPAQPTSAEMTVGQGGADENDPAPGSSKNWSFLSASPVWDAREAVLKTPGFETNQSDAAPLSAVTAPTEPAVVEVPDEVAPPQGNTFLTAFVGFAAMIVAAGFAAFALRKRNPSNAKRRSAFGSRPLGRGKRPEDVAPSTDQNEMARSNAQARRPACSSIDDMELSVRRLLHEVQRRQQLRAHWPKEGKGTTMKRPMNGRSMAEP